MIDQIIGTVVIFETLDTLSCRDKTVSLFAFGVLFATLLLDALALLADLTVLTVGIGIAGVRAVRALAAPQANQQNRYEKNDSHTLHNHILQKYIPTFEINITQIKIFIQVRYGCKKEGDPAIALYTI